MSLENDIKLRHYIQHCDNPYSVVKTIAEIARDKANTFGDGHHILESDALTWVIQGVEPSYVKEYKKGKIMSKTERNQHILNDELCYIDNAIIKNCVRNSINKSIEDKKLTIIYSDLVDCEATKSRIRVLCRMIWCKLEK